MAAPGLNSVVVVGGSLAGGAVEETLHGKFEGTIAGREERHLLTTDRPLKQILAGTWPPEKAGPG